MADAASAKIYLDTNRVISEISPLLFSGFAEHMGRCIYEGIYEPQSPHADENGFRTDVLGALRELNFRSMRYPGGNFLSGYRWEDGVGPKSERPVRRDLAWFSTETNQFGTNEFMDFCRKINTEPMMAVNMGTGTIQDAANLIEYCNAPAGTQYADLRVAHGYADPHNVKYWCIGNEVDGWWQIGHLDMVDYGKKAREAAKLMRWHDPTIETIVCGSSHSSMPSYPDWDRVVLELCWEQVNYHSMHYYAKNHEDDSASFLALSAEFEAFVDTLTGVLRYVKAKNRSKHDVYLSWDEWNISYKHEGNRNQEKWAIAPHIAEEIYNLEDALVIAQWMNVFLRKSDVIKIACLAQIVNIIAPILTKDNLMLKQTIYYPIMLFSRLANGSALDVAVKAPMVATKKFGDMPALDVSSSYNEATGEHAIFIVNRSLTDSITVDLCWQNLSPTSIQSVQQLSGTDPKAENSFEQPNNIVPAALTAPDIQDGVATMVLPPLSFTSIAAEMAKA